MPEKDYLRAFAYDTTTHHVTEAGTAAAGATIGGTFIDARPPDGMPGGFSSVSARKNLDGIVWTAFPLVDGQWNNGSGRIVAFDATTLRPIWYDDGDVNFAKFNAPTVANGKVIRATFSNMVVVYGLRKFTIGRPPWWFSLAARIDTLDQKVNELSNTLGTEVTPQNTEAKPRHRDFVARVVPTPNTVPLMASVHLPHPECARPQPKESTVEIDSSVYESPKYGAHLVRGDIRALWLKLGGPNSRLGFPITDERLTPDMKGRFSRFENGEIWWYPDRGAFVKKSGKQPG